MSSDMRGWGRFMKRAATAMHPPSRHTISMALDAMLSEGLPLRVACDEK